MAFKQVKVVARGADKPKEVRKVISLATSCIVGLHQLCYTKIIQFYLQ
jgi:hypothetical protein